MIHIDRIEKAGPNARARLLVFSDTQVRKTSAAVVRELSLEPDAEVDIDQLGATLDESEARHARDRALRVLGYRDRSCAELRQRLLEDGYPDALVAAIITRYVEVELLDDARFARAWTSTRASAGIGRSRIARELRDKGVDPEVAQAAIGDVLADTDEITRAAAMLRGRLPGNRKERDKLLRRLVTKGFSPGVAMRALDVSHDTTQECESPEDEG
jgi:SOS response regulatory protein OraA/RecX